MKNLLCLLLLLLAAVTTLAAADNSFPDSPYAAALTHYARRERAALARDIEAMNGSDLKPWGDYLALSLGVSVEDNRSGINEFLAREEGSYLAEKLRAELLKKLGKGGDWADFANEYPRLNQPDQELACYALQARLALQQDANVLDEARPLWFKLVDVPEGCAPLLALLAADTRRIDLEARWQRLRRVLEADKPAAIKRALSFLPDKEAPAYKTLQTISNNPARYVARLPAGFAATRQGRELALYALLRMSIKDPGVAAAQWQRIEAAYPAADRAFIWGRLALQAAWRLLPEALPWFVRAENGGTLNEEQRAWKVRAALRLSDWSSVAATLRAMPEPQASEPAWIYWLARAQMQAGKESEARALYARIAGQFNFYGNLAANELGQAIAPPAAAAAVSEAEIAHISAQPDLRRALLILPFGQRVEGVREWSWGLRGLTDRQLLAAAEYARRQNALDRAIAAAERTQAQHDFRLRFLSPYRELVDAKAQQMEIDPAWIYGLMRQESRFVSLAQSAVGAQGLMQLMPATARWVAKKIGLTSYHPKEVHDHDINITLGVNYLRMALKSLGNQPLLASAAYNAGPSRARRWLGGQALEGAIYAECIPFNETRDYVKKVMSNTVYYAALFENKPQFLKPRLGVVSLNGQAAEVAAADDPP